MPNSQRSWLFGAIVFGGSVFGLGCPVEPLPPLCQPPSEIPAQLTTVQRCWRAEGLNLSSMQASARVGSNIVVVIDTFIPPPTGFQVPRQTGVAVEAGATVLLWLDPSGVPRSSFVLGERARPQVSAQLWVAPDQTLWVLALEPESFQRPDGSYGSTPSNVRLEHFDGSGAHLASLPLLPGTGRVDDRWELRPGPEVLFRGLGGARLLGPGGELRAEASGRSRLALALGDGRLLVSTPGTLTVVSGTTSRALAVPSTIFVPELITELAGGGLLALQKGTESLVVVYDSDLQLVSSQPSPNLVIVGESPLVIHDDSGWARFDDRGRRVEIRPEEPSQPGQALSIDAPPSPGEVVRQIAVGAGSAGQTIMVGDDSDWCAECRAQPSFAWFSVATSSGASAGSSRISPNSCSVGLREVATGSGGAALILGSIGWQQWIVELDNGRAVGQALLSQGTTWLKPLVGGGILGVGAGGIELFDDRCPGS